MKNGRRARGTNTMKIRKRFTFAIVAIICISVTTILLKYDAASYFKGVMAIVGIFTFSQTFTDYKGGSDGLPKG